MKSIEVTTLEDEYDKKINSWVQEKQKPARKGGVTEAAAASNSRG